MKCIADHISNITSIQGCERCELSCANTVYEIEKLTKTYVWLTAFFSCLQNTSLIFNIRRNLETNAEKTVSIEYLTWPIIRYKREVLFGWVDLLVSFGGNNFQFILIFFDNSHDGGNLAVIQFPSVM